MRCFLVGAVHSNRGMSLSKVVFDARSERGYARGRCPLCIAEGERPGV